MAMSIQTDSSFKLQTYVHSLMRIHMEYLTDDSIVCAVIGFTQWNILNTYVFVCEYVCLCITYIILLYVYTFFTLSSSLALTHIGKRTNELTLYIIVLSLSLPFAPSLFLSPSYFHSVYLIWHFAVTYIHTYERKNSASLVSYFLCTKVLAFIIFWFCRLVCDCLVWFFIFRISLWKSSKNNQSMWTNVWMLLFGRKIII